MSSNTKPTWTTIRKHLSGWEPAALIALIKDLHDFSTPNRTFLHARITAAAGGGEAMEIYRKRVIEPFYPSRGFGKLKLGEARKAIREYTKATGNIPGTIELLLVFCETGVEFTNEFGNINERFYDSLAKGLADLGDLLKEQGGAAWETVSDRLDKLADATYNIGWGFGDEVRGIVDELRDEFEITDGPH